MTLILSEPTVTMSADMGTLTARLPILWLGYLSEYAEKRDCTRTSVVDTAVKYLLESTSCVFCGAPIPPGGVVCPVCCKHAFTRAEFDRKCELLLKEYIDENNLRTGTDHGYTHSYHLEVRPNELYRRSDFYIIYRVTTPEGLEMRPDTHKNSPGEKIPYETIDRIFDTPEEEEVESHD